jgi:pyrroline-5-carboxylate reductase
VTRLVIIGGGKLGEALVGGLLGSGWATTDELVVVEKLEPRRRELADRYPGLGLHDQPVPAEGALVVVKPPDVPAACVALGDLGERRPRRVLSVAAGVTLATLEGHLPPGTAVVRAMPNTAALVGEGAAAIAPGTACTEAELAWAAEVLSAVGRVVPVTESQLDAVTGLSGSGPAYVFLIAEALVEAGVLLGLPRPTAETLAHQTLLGAGRMLVEGGRTAADLRGDVTSPGGTTAAGLRVLEQRAVRAALLDAVAAAAARSAELGRS